MNELDERLQYAAGDYMAWDKHLAWDLQAELTRLRTENERLEKLISSNQESTRLSYDALYEKIATLQMLILRVV